MILILVIFFCVLLLIVEKAVCEFWKVLCNLEFRICEVMVNKGSGNKVINVKC